MTRRGREDEERRRAWNQEQKRHHAIRRAIASKTCDHEGTQIPSLDDGCATQKGRQYLHAKVKQDQRVDYKRHTVERFRETSRIAIELVVWFNLEVRSCLHSKVRSTTEATEQINRTGQARNRSHRQRRFPRPRRPGNSHPQLLPLRCPPR